MTFEGETEEHKKEVQRVIDVIQMGGVIVENIHEDDEDGSSSTFYLKTDAFAIANIEPISEAVFEDAVEHFWGTWKTYTASWQMEGFSSRKYVRIVYHTCNRLLDFTHNLGRGAMIGIRDPLPNGIKH